MKKLTTTNNEYTPEPTEVKNFESNYGIQLPSVFKTFLLEQNPSDTEETYFTKNNIGVYHINTFYPFHPSGKLSLQNAFDELNEYFESKYIAFGCDSGGWQYVISIQKEDYGKVYFCRMDEALEDALTLLADSFEEFIDGLEVGKR